MTDIGELVVRIKADSTQLTQEMSKATQAVKQSGDQMSGALGQVKEALGALVPAFSAAALIEFGKSTIESTENLIHMADRIGFTTQTLSALEPVLKKNGSDVESFAASVNFLNRNLGLAASGNAPALVKKFDEMGLSVTKLMSMNPQDRFFAVAQAIGQNKDQATLAADAFLLMGRGVAPLLSVLKETGGNFDEVIKKAQALGQTITPDQEKNVRAFESAWVDMVAQMKTSMLDVMPVLNLYLDGISGIINLPRNAFNAGGDLARAAGIAANPRVSTIRPQTVSEATFTGGKGDNKDIDGSAQKAAASAKAMQDYIQNLHDETAALSLGKEQLAEYKAEKAAATAAGIEMSQITPENKAAIDAEADAYVQATEKIKLMNEEQQKQIQITAQLEAQISSSMADIILNFKSVGQTITQVLDQIAKKILEDQVTTPLVNSLGQMLGAPDTAGKTAQATGGPGMFGGVFHMLGFASGGVPPVGVPSIVGENGPELFIPGQTGAIIPNSKLGGNSVIVQQNINLSPGLPETVNAAIRNAAPSIAAMAHAGVMQSLQKGGSESRIVGKRS